MSVTSKVGWSDTEVLQKSVWTLVFNGNFDRWVATVTFAVVDMKPCFPEYLWHSEASSSVLLLKWMLVIEDSEGTGGRFIFRYCIVVPTATSVQSWLVEILMLHPCFYGCAVPGCLRYQTSSIISHFGNNVVFQVVEPKLADKDF